MQHARHMTTLVIATRNRHKVGEIQAILGDGFRCLTLNDFPNAPQVVEDAPTFAGNAAKKAVALAEWLGRNAECEMRNREHGNRNAEMLVLADDSGLEVDALNGAPGVYSARFAAMDGGGDVNSSDADNNAKLLRLLKDVPAERRVARFRCVIALAPVVSVEVENASPVCYASEAELQTEFFEGACEGRIDFAPHGEGGFGYDPLFIPNGHDRSFADLNSAVKNQISHRARALAKLRERLRS
ncbi:MAG: non-canonical purine NTP pyrophosphatase [Pedosphaera parvula]|nr:non-canonical purine NTP pyrophosphatase [Pedosphaera parvula]